MRRVDHGGEVLDAVHAEVRHRGGAALVFVRLELARRARARRGRASRWRWRTATCVSALRTIGVISPPGSATATPMSECLCLSMPAFGPAHIGVGDALQRERQRLDDEVVDRELVGRLAVLVLGRGGVDLLARGRELADVAVDRQVEMRDGLRSRRSAAARWCGACRRAARTRRSLPRRARGSAGRTSRRDSWRRLQPEPLPGAPQAFAGFGALDVARDHPAMRAGALHALQIDAGVLRQAARERRGEDAVAVRRLPALALRDGALAPSSG